MPDEQDTKEPILVTAAKAIGTAAGKIASLAKSDAGPAPTKSAKTPKLAKKNKSRLPRRQKKAEQKATGARVRKSAAKQTQP